MACGVEYKTWLSKAWQNYFGITLEQLDQLTQAIGTALDGRILTREELAQEVGRITKSAAFGAKLAEGSWGTILKPAAFTGRLCFGPSIGQRVRFTRPHTWVNGIATMDPQEATAAITRRFLAAYGPATYHDLGRWWTGGGVLTARQWMKSLGDEVSAVEVNGTPAWMLTADVRKARAISSGKSVRLLPAFDQYVIGASHHAHHLLPGPLRNLVYRPQGWVSPVLLVNGMMQGVWRHEITGSRIRVSIQPFIKVPQWARRGAEQEADRLAAFLGGSLNVSWN